MSKKRGGRSGNQIESGNQIVEILIRRDGMARREAERELLRVREEFDPTCDDPEETLYLKIHGQNHYHLKIFPNSSVYAPLRVLFSPVPKWTK